LFGRTGLVNPVLVLPIPWQDLRAADVEDLIAALLLRTVDGAVRIDGSGGDGGVDVAVAGANGRHVFEIKSFCRRLTAAQKRQVLKSLRTAVEGQPDMVAWTLVLPLDPSPSEDRWMREVLAAQTTATVSWMGRTAVEVAFAEHPELARAFLPGASEPAASDRGGPRTGPVSATDHGLAVGVNYGTVQQLFLDGGYRWARDVTVDLDSLPGDLGLVDPVDPSDVLGAFTGRRWLVDAVDRFVAGCVARRVGGYLLIEAEAGMGKSALATYLAFDRERAWPAHISRLGAATAEAARANLAAQLIARWGLDEGANGLLPDGHDSTAWLYGRLVDAARRRDEVAPGTAVVLLVDGLDEAPPTRVGELPFGLPPRLPPGTVIVATSRPGTSLPATTHVERIEVEGQLNREDLRTHLLRLASRDPRLSRPIAAAGIPQDQFVRMLLERSGGIWIYAASVLDQIRLTGCVPAVLEDLPSGLAGYYADIVGRWADTPALDWDSVGEPLLATLAACQEAQPAGVLARWAGVPESHARKIVRGPFKAFLSAHPSADGDPDVYGLRHKSLLDFCEGRLPADTGVSAVRERAYDLARATRAAHARIVDALTPSGNAADRDWTAASGYARRHLAAHAAAAGSLDELCQDPGFLLLAGVPELLRRRRLLTTGAGRAAVAALELAANSWSDEHTDRLRWLEVSARKTGAHALARNAGRRHGGPWRVHAAIWSGASHQVLSGHDGAVWSTAAVPLPDGQVLVASGDSIGTVQLWDPTAGRCVQIWHRAHRSGVTALAAVPTAERGILLVSGCDDGRMRRFDPVAREPVGRVRVAHKGRVTGLVQAPLRDGRVVLVSSGDDGKLRCWDPATGKPASEPVAAHDVGITAMVAVTLADGRVLLATADEDGAVRLWDPATMRSIRTISCHNGAIWGVATVPLSDGRVLLATGGTDETARLWDPATGRPASSPLVQHAVAAHALAALPMSDGRTLLASGDEDGTVRLWDPATCLLVAGPFTEHGGPLNTMTTLPMPDGRTLLASGSYDRTVRLWDLEAELAKSNAVPGPYGGVIGLTTIPAPGGGVLLASIDGIGTVQLWDPAGGTPVEDQVAAYITDVSALATTSAPDGRTLLVTGHHDDRSIQLWDLDAAGLAGGPLIGHPMRVQLLAELPMPDGSVLLASATRQDFSVRLWNLATRTQAGNALVLRDTVYSLAAVRRGDGATLLAIGAHGRIQLWDPITRTQVGGLEGHQTAVLAVAAVPLSEGRTLLASGGIDGTVRLWDPDSIEPVGDPLTCHHGEVQTVTAVPTRDGRVLVASGHVDGAVRLWDPVAVADTGPALVGHTMAVRAVVAVPRAGECPLLASASEDGAIILWDLAEPHRATPSSRDAAAHRTPVTDRTPRARPDANQPPDAGAPAGVLDEYFAEHLPDLLAMRGPLLGALDGATISAMPERAPSCSHPAEISAAISHRLQLALTADARHGENRYDDPLGALASDRSDALRGGKFRAALHDLLDRCRPHDHRLPVLLADPEQEALLCRLAWWLGQGHLARRGRPTPSVPSTALRDLDEILRAVPDPAVDDLTGLVRAAASGPFARLRQWAAGANTRPDQPFVGPPGAGYDLSPDVVARTTAVVFLTSDDSAELVGPEHAAAWLRRLVGSVLADHSNQYGIRFLAVYLTRQAVGVSWPVDRVLALCAGTAAPRSLAEHRRDVRAILDGAVRHALTSGQDLRGRTLAGIDLRHRDLSGTTLAGAHLHDVDFTGADLSGADLTGARLVRSRLTGVRLTGSRWRQAALLAPHLDEATRSAPELAAAAVTGRDPAEPVLLPARDTVHDVVWSPDGTLLAVGEGTHVLIIAAADLRVLRVLRGHSYQVCAVTFSPDGCLLVTGDAGHRLDGSDARVRVWEMPSGRLRAELSDAIGPADTPAFSPDGGLLAVSCPIEGEVRLWNLATGRRHGEPMVPGSVRALAFSPDGQVIATANYDNEEPVQLWDVATGGQHGELTDISGPVHTLAFSPDGRLLATGDADTYYANDEIDHWRDVRVRLWDLTSDRRYGEFTGHLGQVNAVAFSPDRRLLATGDGAAWSSEPGTVRLWDLPSGRQVGEFSGDGGEVHALAFSPDGRMLATASGRRMRLWEVSSGRQSTTTIRQSRVRTAVRVLAFSPDGRFLATSVGAYSREEDPDARVGLWDVATGRLLRILAGHEGAVHALAFSPDGRALATGDGSPYLGGLGRVRLWDVATGHQLREFGLKPGRAYALAFSPDGGLLASSIGTYGSRGQAEVWEVPLGRPRAKTGDHTGPVAALAFSPDGALLATGDTARGNSPARIRLSEPTSGRRRGELTTSSRSVEALAFSPDGQLLATSTIGDGVQLWEVPSGRAARTLVDARWARSLAFSPDGRLLAAADATGGPAGRVQLWDVTTGRQCGDLVAHAGEITVVAFSPDGRLLASGDKHGTVQLWDPAAHGLLATIAEFENGWAVLLPDGHYKLVGDAGESLWWIMNLHRFEPGQVDDFDPSIRRLDAGAPLPGLGGDHR